MIQMIKSNIQLLSGWWKLSSRVTRWGLIQLYLNSSFDQIDQIKAFMTFSCLAPQVISRLMQDGAKLSDPAKVPSSFSNLISRDKHKQRIKHIYCSLTILMLCFSIFAYFTYFVCGRWWLPWRRTGRPWRSSSQLSRLVTTSTLQLTRSQPAKLLYNYLSRERSNVFKPISSGWRWKA